MPIIEVGVFFGTQEREAYPFEIKPFQIIV
jgi:hypothetical protein